MYGVLHFAKEYRNKNSSELIKFIKNEKDEAVSGFEPETSGLQD